MKKRNDKTKKKSGKKNIIKSSDKFTFFKNIFSNFNNSEFEIENNPKEQIFRSVILFVSIIVSSYILIGTLKDLDKYLPVSDETTNIMQITGGIADECYPYAMPPYASPNFNPETNYLIKKRSGLDTRHYIIENYLRFFVYWGAQQLNISWEFFSSLFYLLLVFFGFFIYSIFSKKQRLPLYLFAILFILIAYSKWASASFHYVRYYPFLFIAQLFSMIFCSYLFTIETKNRILKNLLILAIGYFPAEFHQQGLFSFLFWFVIVIISEIYILFKNKSIPIKYKALSIFSIIIVLIGISIFGEYGIKQGLGLIRTKEEMFYIFGKFIDLNFNTTTIGKLSTSIIFIGGILSITKLSKIERNILLFSILFFLISTIGASMIMGANYSGYHGSNRYHFFLHPIYLVILSLMIIAIFYRLKEFVKQEYIKRIIVSVLFIPFAIGFYQVNSIDLSVYNFSILPKITKDGINKIKEAISDVEYALISTEFHITYNAFPDKKTHYNINTLENFKMEIEGIDNEYLLFYRILPHKLDDKLKAKLNDIEGFNYNSFLIEKKQLINYLSL